MSPPFGDFPDWGGAAVEETNSNPADPGDGSARRRELWLSRQTTCGPPPCEGRAAGQKLDQRLIMCPAMPSTDSLSASERLG